MKFRTENSRELQVFTTDFLKSQLHFHWNTNTKAVDLFSCPSSYGVSKAVMTFSYGIDCGKPGLSFLSLENMDKAKVITDKIESYVAMTRLNKIRIVG